MQQSSADQGDSVFAWWTVQANDVCIGDSVEEFPEIKSGIDGMHNRFGTKRIHDRDARVQGQPHPCCLAPDRAETDDSEALIADLRTKFALPMTMIRASERNGKRLSAAKARAMASSATPREFAAGAREIRIFRSRAKARSMLSMPVPFRLIALRSLAVAMTERPIGSTPAIHPTHPRTSVISSDSEGV